MVLLLELVPALPSAPKILSNTALETEVGSTSAGKETAARFQRCQMLSRRGLGKGWGS